MSKVMAAVLLGGAALVVVLLWLGEDWSESQVLTTAGIAFAIYAATSALAIRDARNLYRNRDLAALRRAMILVKLSLIPVFVMNYVICAVMISSLAFFGVGFVMIPFAVGGTYLVMLPTSAYGLACLMLLKDRAAISPTYLGVNVIAHLLFVLDVISTFVVASRVGHVLRTGAARVTQAAPPAPRSW